jgi:hypothetical protein
MNITEIIYFNLYGVLTRRKYSEYDFVFFPN